jgi:hypothetical protein
LSQPYVARHLRFGWWSLLVFLFLGLTLETLHGFKVGWYLDVSNETRRLMWTLAHAHGALLGLVHIAYAVTLRTLDAEEASWQRWASSCLIGASVLLPGGFFFGGVVTHAGDPGVAIVLAPPGALLLITAVILIARGTRA